MVTRAPNAQLLGRQREREVLDRVLEAAREEHGGVLVVYGEPGVGKTMRSRPGPTSRSPVRSASKVKWS
jgi:MoxR-like ATPase